MHPSGELFSNSLATVIAKRTSIVSRPHPILFTDDPHSSHGFGGLHLSSTSSIGNLRYITLIAIVALLLPLSGCVSDDGNGGDEGKITMILATPSTAPRDTGSETVWDSELAVNKITPKDSTVKWSSVSIVIKRYDGSVLLLDTPVSEDSGLYGSAVEVWYMDSTGERTQADAGDKLLITGMDDGEYEGATVQVLYKGTLIAQSVLPTDFP
jgi:hypothetical protein